MKLIDRLKPYFPIIAGCTLRFQPILPNSTTCKITFTADTGACCLVKCFGIRITPRLTTAFGNGGSSCKICIFLIKLAFVVPHNYRSARPVAAYRTPTGRQGRSASRQCQCCQYQNFLGIKYLQYLLKCFNAFQHSGQYMKRNLIYLPQLWESYAPSRAGSDSTALKDAVSTVKKVLMKE